MEIKLVIEREMNVKHIHTPFELVIDVNSF